MRRRKKRSRRGRRGSVKKGLRKKLIRKRIGDRL